MGGSYDNAGTQYAQIADLQNVMSAAALSHPAVSGASVQNAALLKASEEADAYLRQQFQLPLALWGSDLVQHVCDIAAYRLVCLRGFNPERDGQWRDNYGDSVKWLKDVAECKITPSVTDSSSTAARGKQADTAAPLAFSPRRINSSGTNTRGTWRR